MPDLPPPTQRDLLIETGARLFHRNGWSATGVRQVAAAAAVPQGSFTNHFRSKDGFGRAVLDHYAARLEATMRATLGDGTRAPRARVLAYFDAVAAALREGDWATGCLVPDLATETPTLGDPLRTALVGVLARQTDAFAQALRPLVGDEDAEDLAGVLVAAWQGTLLRMKAERSDAAVARFRRVLDRLLPPG